MSEFTVYNNYRNELKNKLDEVKDNKEYNNILRTKELIVDDLREQNKKKDKMIIQLVVIFVSSIIFLGILFVLKMLKIKLIITTIICLSVVGFVSLYLFFLLKN